MRPRRPSRALRSGAKSMVVVATAMVMTRRTARCSISRGARGGWAGDVTGGLLEDLPGVEPFLVLSPKISSTRIRG